MRDSPADHYSKMLRRRINNIGTTNPTTDRPAAVVTVVEKVLYPEFKTDLEYITDPYWRTQLLDASKGNFPKGVTYVDGKLHFKKKATKIAVELSGSSIEIIGLYINFCRTHLGMISYYDRQIETMLLQQKPKVIYNSWKDIPISARSEYIRRYAESICTRCRLKVDEVIQVIEFGVDLKVLTAQNFVIQNSTIIEITNVCYYEPKNILYFPHLDSVKIKPAIKTNSNGGKSGKLLKEFEKYMMLINKAAGRTLISMTADVPTDVNIETELTESGTRISIATDA